MVCQVHRQRPANSHTWLSVHAFVHSAPFGLVANQPYLATFLQRPMGRFQNSALRGVRGNAMMSRMFCIPVAN